MRSLNVYGQYFSTLYGSARLQVWGQWDVDRPGLVHPADPFPRGSPHSSWACSYQGRFLALDAEGCCHYLCTEVSMVGW